VTTGTINIANTAQIHTNEKSIDTTYGSAHGGRGTVGGGTIHGDYRNPEDIGSRTNTEAGGLIKIKADTINLNSGGTISSNGQLGGTNPSGSGGSVNIVVNTILGNGTISANGGVGTYGHQVGGGGRMAVRYGTWVNKSIATLSAKGGFSLASGAAGTIFLAKLNNGINDFD